MSVLRNQYDQIRRHWDRLTDKQKIGLGSVLVLAIFGVGAIGWWSSRPHYIPLADGMSLSETADVKSKLDSAGIPNKLSYSGTGILVPTNKHSEAKLVAGDIVGDDEGVSPAGNKLLSDPGNDQNRNLKAQQKSIEQSLLRLTSVESADVHIAKPEWSPFIVEKADTTAAVVLGIKRGHRFGAQQAATVVELVAGSVDGLLPENVTVSDLNGQILSSGQATGAALIDRNHSHRKAVENELAAKAEKVLSEMFGPGRAVVRVTATIDFTELQRTEEFYDPDSKVVSKEKIENTTNATPAPVGPAGVTPNVTLGSSANAANNGMKMEKLETDYLNAKTTDTTSNSGGVIKRITVAAVVDVPAANPNDPAAPVPPTKQQIENVIKQAVGFDATRSDEIEVLLQPLAGVAAVDIVSPPTMIWETLAVLAKNASLGIAAIVAFVLGVLFLRKIQPVLESQGSSGESSAKERTKILAELSEQAKQNPEVVSRILSAWLDSSKANDSSTESTNSDEPELKVVGRAA